ncbi:MAG: YCF48-related protein, partial [Bacteroidota bacterium]|nr:YCF48-related protein [Bacteroidota bacterium]
MKTSNGGVSWNRLSSGINDTLFSIHFTDENSGYACGRNGKIIKTTDAGKSWLLQTSGTLNILKNIYFFNPDKGFICGHGSILKTTNGGNNWTANIYASNFNTLTFINDNTGFAAGGRLGAELRKTTNGGNSWFFNTLPALSGALTSIQFINPTTGFMSGNSSAYFKTTNSGLNWIYDNTITEEGYNLASVYFANLNEGYLAGTNGKIYKTSDAGNNWALKAGDGPVDNFIDISFPNYNTGYIRGVIETSTTYETSIYKTTNEGINWLTLILPFENVFKMNFFEGNIGYVQSNFNLYKTSNGGGLWNQIFLPTNSVGEWQFVDANTGFYLSYSGGFKDFYKTTNGGNFWNFQYFSPEGIRFFQFPQHDVGYMISNVYNLYKSSNTGNSWKFVRSLNIDSASMKYLYFIDENSGFVVFQHLENSVPELKYNFFKTTDGGLNWNLNHSLIYNTYDFVPLSIKFINNNTGYITKLPDKLLKTTNQGNDWFEYKITDRRINDIEFTDDSTGYGVGHGGIIKKTTNGGVVAIQNISSVIPENIILYQNYPNPFNPETVISYKLRINTFVLLKVYDMAGKEIKTLVNEKKTAGSYQVVFDGRDLPSGVYFYHILTHSGKIEEEDLKETKKMVLIK